MPQQVSAKVDDLAAALIKHVNGKSVESSSEKLLEFLTNLIQKTLEEENSATPRNQQNISDWILLKNNTTNHQQKITIAKKIILEHASGFFQDYTREEGDSYLQKFLPKELMNKDFEYLQQLAQQMDPPIRLEDNPENRRLILEEKRGNLKATLDEWFNYLNDTNGGRAYLSNETRHWIFNSVSKIEMRILNSDITSTQLDKILEDPAQLESNRNIDPTAFKKFQEIIDKYHVGVITIDEIKEQITQETNRNPELDFDFKEKLHKLCENQGLNKPILYSLILNDPRGTKVNFQTRSENSIRDFPILNPALIGEINDVVKICEESTGANIHDNIQVRYGKENPAFAQFLQNSIQAAKHNNTISLNFAPLYAFLQNQASQDIDLTVTKGEWVKFAQNSDPKELRDSIKGFNTGWCIQGLETAKGYLERGDLHVYFSNNTGDEPKVPRLAIAMTGDEISEIRGIAANQSLDPFIANATNNKGINTLEEKLQSTDANNNPVFPNAEKWLKTDKDNKYLGILYIKFQNNEELNKDDLFFLYQIGKPIKKFGLYEDKRISEILSKRDPQKDLAEFFGDEMNSEILSWHKWRPYDYSMLSISIFRSQPNVAKLIFKKLKENLSPDSLMECLLDKNINYGFDALLGVARTCNNAELYELISNELKANLSKQTFLDLLINSKDKDGNNVLMSAARVKTRHDDPNVCVSEELALQYKEREIDKKRILQFIIKDLKSNDLLSGALSDKNNEGKGVLDFFDTELLIWILCST